MKKFFRIFFALFILLAPGCSKDCELPQIKNLNNNSVSAFGHAGMGIFFKYPVNSFESLEPSIRIGADGTEMDVQMTKDSILVLFHDQKLKDGTMCTGVISDKTWSDIKDCLHACPYSNSVDMITADYFLGRMNRENLTFTFDCKLYREEGTNARQFYSTYANALIQLINKYNFKERIFIESSDTDFLRILKNRDSELKLFIYPSGFESGLKIANEMNLYGITISNDKITAEQVDLAHKDMRRVTVWNVQCEKENVEAIKKNVDYIQSDKLIPLLKVLGKHKKQGIKNLRW